MNNPSTAQDPIMLRLARLGLPTLFIWFITFDWIGRAYPGIQIAARIFFILMGCLWLILRWRDAQPLHFTSISLLLLLYYAYSTLLVPFAPLPFHSLEIELNNLFYFAVFLFYLNDVRTRATRNAWHFAFLQAAIIFSLFNLFIVGRWWWEWLLISGGGFQLPPFGFRLPGLFLQHPNYEAAYLNLIFPFIFVGLLKVRSLPKKIGLSCLLLLFLLTSFFASSRGAWLGMAASLGTVIILQYRERLTTNLRHFLHQRRIRISSKNLALIAVGIAATAGIGLLSYKQAQFGGHGGRWGLWAIAWDIIKESPIFGHGPGSVHVLSAVHSGIPPGFYLGHAHNLVLQILGEAGIVGLAISSLILFTLTAHFIRSARDRAHEFRALIPYAAVLAGMLTHQLVDYAFEAPLYTVGILFAVAQISSRGQAAAYSIKNKGWQAFVIIVIAFVYGTGSYFGLRGHVDGYEGVLAMQTGNWDKAQLLLCQASERNKQDSLLSFQCGFAAAAASATGQVAQGTRLASEAYDRGLEQDPYWPFHRAGKASLAWNNGDRETALQSMLQAHEAAPRSAILALNLGYYYAELGQSDQARVQISAAYELDPWYWMSAQDPWKPPGSALDPQNLQSSEASLIPSIFAAWKGWMHLQAGEIPGAQESFKASLELDPARVEANAGMAQLSLRKGDFNEALRFIQIGELTGRSSWLLEDVKGQLNASQGDMDSAYEHWIAATRLWFWTTHQKPYYGSVYGQAYIPIDLPPQVIQPSLPQSTAQGFEQALRDGTQTIQDDAMKIIPWYEQQIHLIGGE